MIENSIQSLLNLNTLTIEESKDVIESTLNLLKSFNALASTSNLSSQSSLNLDESILEKTQKTSLLYPAPSLTSIETGINWLRSKIQKQQSKQQNNNNNLLQEILSILSSPSEDDEIASSLLEIWGYEEFDNVGESIRRRKEIVESYEEEEDDIISSSKKSNNPTHSSGNNHRSNLDNHRSTANQSSGGTRTPQAQIVFQTSADIAAAKRARKLNRHQKGKGREGDYDDEGEVDLEEWERLREESLALGPGALVSGNRVRTSSLCEWLCRKIMRTD